MGTKFPSRQDVCIPTQSSFVQNWTTLSSLTLAREDWVKRDTNLGPLSADVSRAEMNVFKKKTRKS